MRHRFCTLLAGGWTALALAYAAHAAPETTSTEVPPQIYASHAETDMNFTVDLQKNGKAVFTWMFQGDVDKAQGTWEQQGSRVTIKTKGRKRSQDATYVFEYRSELKSPDSQYAKCKNFAEGLLPININNGNSNFTKQQFLGFYAWPQKQVKSKTGPCLR